MGGAHVRRGKGAKVWLVAWNQPSLYELSTYNTVRPFYHVQIALRRAVRLSRHREEERRFMDALEWTKMVEKTKDWREVAEEKLEELEALAETLKKMALWHLGVTEEHGSVRPFAEEEPASWKAASILESVSRIQVSCAVARCRVLETEKAADRKRREYGKISAALSEVESAARVKAWQEREVAKA